MTVLFQKILETHPWTLFGELSFPNPEGYTGIDRLHENGINLIVGTSGDIEIAKNGICQVRSPQQAICYSCESPMTLPIYYTERIHQPFLGRIVGIDIDFSYFKETVGFHYDNLYQGGYTCPFDFLSEPAEKTHHVNYVTAFHNDWGPSKPWFQHNLAHTRTPILDEATRRYGERFDCYGPNLHGPRWHGRVDDGRNWHYTKLDKIKNYTFTICGENSDFDRWITEKISHALTARSIPIFIGARDINRYVPKELFINFKDFETIQECFDFVDSLSQQKINSMIDDINEWVKKPENTYPLDSIRFADELIRAVKDIERIRNGKR
jgi:hypothetical protein